MYNFSVFFPLTLCIFGIPIYSLTDSTALCVCKFANFSACINEVRLSCCFPCNIPESAGELREQVCTATVRLCGGKQAHNDFYQVEYQQRHLPPL